MAVNPEALQPHPTYLPTEPVTLDFHGAPLTEEQFEELCRNSPDLKFELSSKGELIIVPPTSPESGWRNSELITEVTLWSRKHKTGITFDSQTLFSFPNNAKRSPDVSWMTREKWEALSLSERKKFSRVVPDFVIELLSPSDDLADTKEKIEEYIENGVRLGWLIDPMDKKVHIYRANGDIEILDNPEAVPGEDVLNGFVLNVREIW
jgi:Uma2 family endonuclease